MVRWRLCLVLAMLLLLPRTGAGPDDDGDDDDTSENSEDEEEEEQDEGEEAAEKSDGPVRRAPAMLRSAKPLPITRTVKKLPLECYVCAYKSETPLRSCLDPTKYRVHSVTCHSVDEKCFTSVISKGGVYEAVVRGCRTGCVPNQDTKCCELNRCNSEAFAMPAVVPRAAPVAKPLNKTSKTHPSSVVFFITILLVLQTVVKVSFV